MQERNINTRNISKKRSENIKISKKIPERIKDSNNLIPNHIHNNNINNGISLNKACAKIDKKGNLRNISKSTKYMKTKVDEKEKDKFTHMFKTKNKHSMTKEKDRDYTYNNIIKKDDKQYKSKKKYMNTKDILLNRNNNNHSFNHFKKFQNLNSNNTSLKNIDSSYYREIYNPTNPTSYKRSKIPRFPKYDKKNIYLPFYFHLKKSDIKSNYKRKKVFSKRSDFNSILKELNTISNFDLAKKILNLIERGWLDELRENSALIEKNLNSEKNKNSNNENNNTNTDISKNNTLNEFIKGRIMIQEDFNWMLWAMGIVFFHVIQKSEKNFENFDKLNNIQNINDILTWRKGFIYNGIYFFLLNKIENNNQIKIIKREIKSLNLLFLDYIQLLDNIPQNKIYPNSKPYLSNNIIFPLISLLELTDYYLLASLALEPSFEKKDVRSFILNEEEYINNNSYYNNIDISNYYLENLRNSPLFINITENNLLILNNGKLLLMNVAKNLHPLMIPETKDNQDNDNIYQNNIYLKYPIITHIIGKEEQIFNKAFLNYFEYFINYLQNNKYIIDIPNLEYEMNKFGINKCFYLFILSKIKLNNSCDFDTNNNICSLIKIYILVKLLTKIDEIQFSKDSNSNTDNININKYNNKTELNRDTKSESSYATASHKPYVKSNSRKKIKFSTEKKLLEFNTQMTNSNSNSSNVNIHNPTKNKNNNPNANKRGIKFISQIVLTILNPKSPLIEINNDYLIYKLLYQSYIYLEKFKKLNSRIFSCDVSQLYEPRSFLKSLITSARKNPFIFLKQIENKFNVLFNYEIKYRTSICLENFMKYFNDEKYITEKEPQIIYSYINAEEIGSYLFIKNIHNDLINNNTMNNNSKKKGSKIMKNISSENMDYFYGKMNYDNFSILNRSIIQNRNSNFRILNSSKEKLRKNKINDVPLYTECNSNKNFLLSNDYTNNFNESNNKNKIDNVLSGSNVTSSNNNIGSESTNNNEDLMLNNNKTNDKPEKKSEENNNLDMYEFGDEESEKSNFSYEEANIPQHFNKKRNTTNLNNSKFNLNNMNKNNGNSSNSKTLNTLNYNINTSNGSNNNVYLNNKVFNGKNLINNMVPSGSTGIMNTINKNKSYYWHSLFNNYHFKFPGNLYKVYTQELKSNLPIYKYLSMYYSFFSFFPYSTSYFFTPKNSINNIPKEENSSISQLLTKQMQLLENIFSDFISINQDSSYILINFYIYYFLNFYFVENDKMKLCEEVLEKINAINTDKILYKKVNYQIVINLLNGLLYSKDNFLKVEEYFTKALILSLIEYGEPRGRNNDGRSIMMFPVWKTGRNFLIMDNNEIINENFKEMYKTLLYYNENKSSNKNNNLNSYINEAKNLDYLKLIDKNILNDLYRETKYDIKNTKKVKKFNLNLGNNRNNLKPNNFYTNINNNRINKPFVPFENKTSFDSSNNNKKKNNSGYVQNYLENKNEDTFFNFNEEDMLERPSQGNLYDELYLNNNKDSDNNLKKNFINDNKYINTNNNISNKFFSKISSDATIKMYFKENLYFPEIKFPSMNDKKVLNINLFFFSEKFFIYFVKSIFSLINYSSNESSFTAEYLRNNIFEENQINNNHINNNKKPKFKLEKILNENLYYKKYNQSNILVSFGNNSHCETGHVEYKIVFGKIEYKPLLMPRVLYQLKNKEILSIKSGWEHNVCQDSNKMLYSWGNNSRGQCGFEKGDNVNGIISFPKNIFELNDKNIKEISCGNEHTLALTKDGNVFSWGSTSDGVLGREVKGEEKKLGIGKPGKITFFIKNDIKIRHISSGSIHNLCLDVKSNLYSWGCSKGGQLGFDEKELAVIYKQNNSNSANTTKSKSEIEKDNNFCLSEPKLIKSLKDIEIIKISSGEAHNAALSIDGKCYVWGLSSNGQLGLGFCADCFPYGEGLQKSRVFTPTIIKDFDKNNNAIAKVFCGKTFTIFLNQKDELFSTGINDLNQCGIDNKLVENINLCNDIISPIKIEMFIRMKIINISCGESHVLAITEDNGIRMLFSWGSNRFGQLGQGINTKKSLPKIVNYFLHYNNSEVSQVSCGAFHSLVLIKMKDDDKYKPELDEKYVFGIIDKYEDYVFEEGN